MASSFTALGQHSLSVNTGWTFSNLYKVGTEQTFKSASYYDESLNLTLYHAPYVDINYNYLHNNFRLSTGLSALSVGANNYVLESAVAYMYLTAPLLVGYQVNFSDRFSLVIEGGGEAGFNLLGLGSVTLASKMNTVFPYLGALFCLEGKYKKFHLGARFHLGLNTFTEERFNNGQNVMHLRHIAGTVYIGYTFWDSSQPKKAKKKK